MGSKIQSSRELFFGKPFDIDAFAALIRWLLESPSVPGVNSDTPTDYRFDGRLKDRQFERAPAAWPTGTPLAPLRGVTIRRSVFFSLLMTALCGALDFNASKMPSSFGDLMRSEAVRLGERDDVSPFTTRGTRVMPTALLLRRGYIQGVR